MLRGWFAGRKLDVSGFERFTGARVSGRLQKWVRKHLLHVREGEVERPSRAGAG